MVKGRGEWIECSLETGLNGKRSKGLPKSGPKCLPDRDWQILLSVGFGLDAVALHDLLQGLSFQAA